MDSNNSLIIFFVVVVNMKETDLLTRSLVTN